MRADRQTVRERDSAAFEQTDGDAGRQTVMKTEWEADGQVVRGIESAHHKHAGDFLCS